LRGVRPSFKDLLIGKFNDEIVKVGLAQMDDVYWGFAGGDPPASSIERMYRYKTSRYTFSLPFAMGAVLAGRPSSVVRRVEELGENIGLVFQLRDDTIGLLSLEKEIGKPVGSDVREDKKTLIRHHLFRRASAAQRKVLRGIFGKKQVTRSDLARIRAIWERTGMDGALAAITRTAAGKAARIIAGLPVSAAHRGILSDLVAYVGERKK
jgi:geranylgeranyl diphosphate synthase type I